MFNVEQIYKEARLQNEPLLSNYDADFWEVYVDNYTYFDRLFMKTYRSFVPFNAMGDSIETVTIDFTQDVWDWLLANDKRYSELYRLQLVDDDKYNFMFNYDMKEIYTGSHSEEGTETLGERNDERSTETVYGATSESIARSETLGSYTNTRENTTEYGEKSKEDVDEVSAFNSSEYSPKEKITHTEEGVKDVINITDEFGSRENGNTEARTGQSHTDAVSGSDVKGEQTNTSEKSGMDTHTITRQGNIGVETTSDIMRKHVDLWSAFSFYKIVFDDIADQFLRVE